jgi:hypothetical protein
MISIVSRIGKKVGSAFRKRPTPKPSNLDIFSVRIPEATSKDRAHLDGLSFGIVYANEKARTNIYYNSPTYPVGSIIVREKHEEKIGVLPQTVIAMVKREAGFSPNTGDWEFFMLDGRTLALQLRETTGNCAACHVQAKDTDWSFRSYMNFTR